MVPHTQSLLGLWKIVRLDDFDCSSHCTIPGSYKEFTDFASYRCSSSPLFEEELNTKKTRTVQLR